MSEQVLVASGLCVLLLILGYGSKALALDWVPTQEEMEKYRRSWNPPTHGTSFTSSADVSRQGH
ncbi:MAG TPA: hypothetical protein VFS39_18020 [Nitrospira sp.]|nr:hypothetical protein [Nitrospira sp.]